MGILGRLNLFNHQSATATSEACLSPGLGQNESGILRETSSQAQSLPAPKASCSASIQHLNPSPEFTLFPPAAQINSRPGSTQNRTLQEQRQLAQYSTASMEPTHDFSALQSDLSLIPIHHSKILPGGPLKLIPSDFYDKIEPPSLANIPKGPLLKRAVFIRRKLQPLRAQYSSNESSIQAKEQSILKEWRELAADENSDSSKTLQRYKELGFATEKFMKYRRKDLALLWQIIRPLEHELDAVENRLLESEEQESHSEPPQIMRPSESLPTPISKVQKVDPMNARNELAAVHEETESMPLTPSLKQDDEKERAEDEGAWSEEGDGEEGRDWDPSRYHPKYVELQDQIADVKLAEERLNYFFRRMTKLQDQRKKRHKVKLRLLPADEQELERLPNTILSLQLELDVKREKADKLKDECLFLGIANPDESPVEVISVADEESGNLETAADGLGNEDSKTQYEAWDIKTPGGRKARKLTKEAAWAAASITQDIHHSEKSIHQTIERLDFKKKVADKYKHLTAAQRQCVDALCDRRNSEKPVSKIQWFLAQIELQYRNKYHTISSNSVRGERRRVVVAMKLYLKRELKPEAKGYKIEESGFRNPQHNDAPYKLLTDNSPPSSHQYLMPTPPQSQALRSHITPAASSGSSGPTKLALAINSHGNQSGAAIIRSELKSSDEGQLHSNLANELTHVEWWIFQQLEISWLEVRLLATILQAAEVPWSEETAGLVIKHWYSPPDEPDEERRYWAVQSSRTNWIAATKQIRAEGYDKMLLPQILGYALKIGGFEDENEDQSVQDEESLRGSESENAELGLA